MNYRLAQLVAGLILYGFSMALMVRAGLGLNPWDVFHQGVAPQLGLSLGMVVNLVGLVILLLWIPLRQKPGIGTVLNVLLIGTAADFSLRLVPEVSGLPFQSAMLLTGIALNGLACGAYLGAGLGAGPRDGLMTGIVGRTGWSVRTVRTTIEVGVLATGWLLGGTVGVGTVLYAVAIGPIVHVTLPWLTIGASRKKCVRRIRLMTSERDLCDSAGPGEERPSPEARPT